MQGHDHGELFLGFLGFAGMMNVNQSTAYFKVNRNNVDQTGLSNNVWTTVAWTNELWDVGSHFASNVWTPPAGLVVMIASLILQGSLANGADGVAIIKNGSNVSWKAKCAPNAASSTIYEQVTYEDYANGTDTYGVQGIVNGASPSIGGGTGQTWFTGYWVSPQ